MSEHCHIRLNPETEKERTPLAGTQPQLPQCLTFSHPHILGEPDFDDYRFCHFVFQPRWRGGVVISFSSCHPQGNYLLINPFVQVLIYLLSFSHIPSIVLIMVNTGDTTVIKIKSLPYGTDILETDINRK